MQDRAAAEGGSFTVTHRLVLSISVPMTLAYLTTPLLGLADTAVVGRLGDPALLGGLAAGAIIFDLAFSSFNFLRTGTTGLVAQAFGRSDPREEKLVLLRAMILAVGIGVALVIAGPVIIWLANAMMGLAEPVAAAMAAYLGIRLLSAPFAMLNYAILGYVLGRGEGYRGLALQILLNGTNITLSIWLGLSMGWGLAGVAWATVAAELVASLAGLAIVVRRFRGTRFPAAAEILDRDALARMISVNGDIMIRSFVLIFAFALMTRQGGQLGTLTLAANAILMNIFMLTAYFLDGYATAAEQLAGRAVGSRQPAALSRAVRLTAIWGFATAIVLALAVVAVGDLAIAALTTIEAVRSVASTFLPWAALTAVTGVLAFQMDGVFIGATWSREMRNMMLVSFALFLAAVFILPVAFGNHGLWAALHLFLIARGLTLLAVLPSRAAREFS